MSPATFDTGHEDRVTLSQPTALRVGHADADASPARHAAVAPAGTPATPGPAAVIPGAALAQEAPRGTTAPGRAWRVPGVAMLIVGVALGLAGGAYWRDAIAHWLGTHGHDAAGAAGAAAGEKKQLWTCGMHPQVIQDKPGNCPICGMALTPLDAGGGGATGSPEGGRKVKYWWDPMMSPPYISQRPGKSPMGMDLVPVYEDDVLAANAVKIDPVMVQNMGVRVAEVRSGPVVQSARVVGYLEEAQPRIRDVNLRVSGWVEKLHADTEGMRVNKGDPLFELYSPEVKVAVEELIAARRSMGRPAAGADEVARRTYEVLVAAARQKLELWGLGPEEVEGLEGLDAAPRTVTFRSPITGDLTEKMLVEGAAVKAGDRALRIVDHSTLWLDTQVFAQDMALVKVGRKVTAQVEAVKGKAFEGQVAFVHPQVDPMTRTVRVRMELPNPDLTLRPGMFATVHISATVAERALLVPREAVIDAGDRKVVFVSVGDGKFEPRKVTTGLAADGGAVQVLDGLAPGELAVTSGQFLLDAESRMREAIQKHLAQKLLKPPATAGGVGVSTHAGHDGHGPSAASAAGPAPASASPQASPAWRGAVDAAVSEYLKLARALGEVQRSNAPLDPAALLAASESLAGAAERDGQRASAHALLAAVKPLAGLGLDDQRKAFKAVSAASVELAEQTPPSKATAGKLFVLYCSMADAYWLQDHEEKANPYYATAMKSCAEVKRVLGPSRGQ